MTRVPVARTTRDLRRAYLLMRAHFGHQEWWPGETPFEVCVGAILVQNTNWSNVERAIGNLKSEDVLEPAKLHALPEARLAQLIRPAGYFNVKARRLRAFLRTLVDDFDGDVSRLLGGDTRRVRDRLLAIHGIGPETADSLLLYAGGHPRFVIDAYTKRIFERHQWPAARRGSAGGNDRGGQGPSYEALQALCESALQDRAEGALLDYWQDYHAQLVMVGKHFCRPRQPQCRGCPLEVLLPRRRKT